MGIPRTYQAFRRTTGEGPLTIEPSTEAYPGTLGPTDVLIKVHAVSLNPRDIMMLSSEYPFTMLERGVPASDAAAEVVSIGSGVKNFQIGDLSAHVEGVLREYAIFDEKVLVHIPKHLSWEEASIIACAGVTAWTAINCLQGLNEETTVLLEGSGSISTFALQFLIASNIRVIITSSCDEKIQSLKKLSPLIHGINYRTQPNIAEEVHRLTNGTGVNLIVNNSGEVSIASNIDSLANGGTISLVRFLGGYSAEWKPSTLLGLLWKHSKIQGISVGYTSEHAALNRFLEEKKLPLDSFHDRTFNFDEAAQAIEYLRSGKSRGKVIIRI